MLFGCEHLVLVFLRLQVAVVTVAGEDVGVVGQDEKAGGYAVDDLSEILRSAGPSRAVGEQGVTREQVVADGKAR